MRRTIAVNLDNFRAAPENFDPRPQRNYPTLPQVDAPFFSVVVPTYNGLRHMAGVLGALQQQTFSDSEVIVVDDASSDATAQWVAEHYPWVRLIVNRRNIGFAASCNTGAAAARGRYVVLLNNDTEPEATWLAELARTIAAHPDAAIVASKLLLYDRRDTLHTTGDTLGLTAFRTTAGCGNRPRAVRCCRRDLQRLRRGVRLSQGRVAGARRL